VDKQVRRLALGLIALFVLLLVQVNYIQVFAADRLANDPHNSRLIILEYRTDRGDILARDGRTVLAQSDPTEGDLKFLRTYPQGSLFAHLTGYYSFIFGRDQLESRYNEDLGARSEELFPSSFLDQLLGRPKRGATVTTTIDPELQRVAAQALGQQLGGVAAIQPATGQVLALVANPTFDPNPLSSHNGREIRRTWRQLIDDPDKPLLSNATDQIYPPGSTFKLITAAAALENGFTPESEFPNPPELELPQTTELLSNAGGVHCNGGSAQITLAEALKESCNVTFGQVGLELGPELLRDQAVAFGFTQDVAFDVPFEEGHFPDLEFFVDRIPAVAFSAIGQQDVATNPLQMALVAAAIANGGVMMQPRLVQEVRDPQGLIVQELGPQEWGRPISPETSADLTSMMEAVVQSGTGTAAQIPGFAVAGKTGTATHGEGEPPHAWFVAFAPADAPTIAVAVMVLNGGGLGDAASGGRVAAPIARAVMAAALGVGG
jgi:penicillin-binding protein A